MNLPLYRSGDKIPRLELTETQELEEQEAKASASAASERVSMHAADSDPGVSARVDEAEEEEGWRGYDEGGDSSGDTDTGGAAEGFLEDGAAFEAGIARYPEKADAAPYVEPLEVR